MRCSLLALSSYIDTELDAEPAGELEAHLVACDRCRTAIGHLREESERIGSLARVHVPDDAVHELFSQIGLIAEEDELPEGPVHRDRPAPVEAPPWFGAERGAALPWAPRPTGQSQPRELVGERSPVATVADPELLLWDETIDQVATAIPEPPPFHVLPAPQPVIPPEVEPVAVAPAEPYPVVYLDTEPSDAAPAFSEPPPPQVTAAEPQPPDLSTSAPMVSPPRLAAGTNTFQRLRDAVAVRFALRRRGDADYDSGVEIVSGVGAPRWDQRARPRHWNDSPPIVTASAPAPAPAPTQASTTEVAKPQSPAPVVQPPSPAPVAKPNAFSRFMARITAVPPLAEPDDSVPDDTELEHPLDPADAEVAGLNALHDDVKPATRTDRATPRPELADMLSEVSSLAAPLERAPAPATNGTYAAPESWMDERPGEPSFEYRRSRGVAEPVAEVEPVSFDEEATQFGVQTEPAAPPAPGRHVRRLHSQRSDRREWNPAQPVTGRHVLPLGGPAVGAADRDRRLWLFGALTVVVILLGLLVGRQVTQTTPLASAHAPRTTAPAHHATTTPPTAVPLPVQTPVPAPTAIIPSAPTPQQLTSATTLGSGSSGFSVADVRYGEHPNDFRLVFDMAFPDTVTGAPTTVVGYYGTTTMYVEFMGVLGASNIAPMPAHQVVVSVEALPMVRNTDRLILKITLSKKAPFDAYYLSGSRLVIDIT